MTVRALKSDGGIVTSGSHFISTGAEEVAQTITTRLRLFLGEYFRDNTDGTDWFGSVLGKGNTTGVADAELRRRISQTENVNGIISFESNFDFETREYSVSCSVITPYGDVDVTTEDTF